MNNTNNNELTVDYNNVYGNFFDENNPLKRDNKKGKILEE